MAEWGDISVPESCIFISYDSKIFRSINDDYIDVATKYEEEKVHKYRTDSTYYHNGLFEWTHFRSNSKDSLYLLLIVDKIINTAKVSPDEVRFRSTIKEAIAG
jgi:hypothetical protein